MSYHLGSKWQRRRFLGATATAAIAVGGLACSDGAPVGATLEIPGATTAIVQGNEQAQFPGGELVLKVPGGTAPDGIRMVASGAPRFQLGEKVLVFAANYDGQQWVYGWSQGKYTMRQSRIVAQPGSPIDKDILSYPLRRKIQRLLSKGG